MSTIIYIYILGWSAFLNNDGRLVMSRDSDLTSYVWTSIMSINPHITLHHYRETTRPPSLFQNALKPNICVCVFACACV